MIATVGQANLWESPTTSSLDGRSSNYRSLFSFVHPGVLGSSPRPLLSSRNSPAEISQCELSIGGIEKFSFPFSKFSHSPLGFHFSLPGFSHRVRRGFSISRAIPSAVSRSALHRILDLRTRRPWPPPCVKSILLEIAINRAAQLAPSVLREGLGNETSRQGRRQGAPKQGVRLQIQQQPGQCDAGKDI